VRVIAQLFGSNRGEGSAVVIEDCVTVGLRLSALHGHIDKAGLISIAKTRRPLASPAMVCEQEPQKGS